MREKTRAKSGKRISEQMPGQPRGPPRGERGRMEPPSPMRAPLAPQNALEPLRPAAGFFWLHSGSGAQDIAFFVEIGFVPSASAKYQPVTSPSSINPSIIFHSE